MKTLVQHLLPTASNSPLEVHKPDIVFWFESRDHRTTVHLVPCQETGLMVVMADGNLYAGLRRTEAASYVVRANWEIEQGAFQICPDTNRVFYRLTVLAPSEAQTRLPELIAKRAARTYAVHHARLLAVIYQGVDPAKVTHGFGCNTAIKAPDYLPAFR